MIDSNSKGGLILNWVIASFCSNINELVAPVPATTPAIACKDGHAKRGNGMHLSNLQHSLQFYKPN